MKKNELDVLRVTLYNTAKAYERMGQQVSYLTAQLNDMGPKLLAAMTAADDLHKKHAVTDLIVWWCSACHHMAVPIEDVPLGTKGNCTECGSSCEATQAKGLCR